jgi:hypothetical protein
MCSAVALAVRAVVGGCTSSPSRDDAGSARAGHSSMQNTPACRHDPADKPLHRMHPLVLLRVETNAMLNST